jgi:hypothetical protein
MAEAMIHLKDTKAGIQMEVKFTPAIDNASPAHQIVSKVAELCGMEQVKPGEAETSDKPT